MLLYIIFYSFIYYINNTIHYNSNNSVFIHIHTYFYNAIHVERQVVVLFHIFGKLCLGSVEVNLVCGRSQ